MWGSSKSYIYSCYRMPVKSSAAGHPSVVANHSVSLVSPSLCLPPYLHPHLAAALSVVVIGSIAQGQALTVSAHPNLPSNQNRRRRRNESDWVIVKIVTTLMVTVTQISLYRVALNSNTLIYKHDLFLAKNETIAFSVAPNLCISKLNLRCIYYEIYRRRIITACLLF